MSGQPRPKVARGGAAALVAVAVAVCASVQRPSPGEFEPHEMGSAMCAPRLIDVNFAGADELALLPGIGPAIAARIVGDRSERGPFASVDDLRRVKGIGASTLERVRPFATAGDPA